MSDPMKKIAGGLFFLLLFSLCAAEISLAQNSPAKSDAKNENQNFKPDLAKLVGDMTPQDRTNEQAVQKQEAAQTLWMDYVLRILSTPGKEQEMIQANKDMIAALTRDGEVDSKVWLLHLLGWTAGDSEITSIAAFILDKNDRLADESLRALALIGSPKAIKAMVDALPQAEENRKAQIKGMIRQTVHDMTVGTETVLPMALPYVSDEKCAQWVARFPQMNSDERARTLAALTVRNDKKYRSLPLQELKSENPEVVKAAIFALEKLGTDQDLLSLTSFFNGPHRADVLTVLSRFVSDTIENALMEKMKISSESAEFSALAETAVNRNMKAALPLLLARIKSSDCPDRIALIKMTQKIASPDNVPDFIEALSLLSDRKDKGTAEQIIAALCQGNAALIIRQINEKNTALLIGLLGRIGGPDAMAKIEEYLAPNVDPVLKDLAVRSLSNWPNAEAAKILWDIAENPQSSPAARIQSLRAFVRVITLPDNSIGIKITNSQRLEHLQKAMKTAERIDEKRLIVQRCGSVRDSKICEYLLILISVAELEQDVCRSIVDLAHHDYLRKQNPDLFRKALTAVLEKSNNQELKDRAVQYRDALK